MCSFNCPHKKKYIGVKNTGPPQSFHLLDTSRSTTSGRLTLKVRRSSGAGAISASQLEARLQAAPPTTHPLPPGTTVRCKWRKDPTLGSIVLRQTFKANPRETSARVYKHLASAHYPHSIFYIQPLKMEPTEGSETSADLKLTPGKYPKEHIQYSKRDESLKSRTISFDLKSGRYCALCGFRGYSEEKYGRDK